MTSVSRPILIVSGLLLIAWILIVSDHRQLRGTLLTRVPAATTKPIEYERFYGGDPTRFILYSPPGFALPPDAPVPGAR